MRTRSSKPSTTGYERTGSGFQWELSEHKDYYAVGRAIFGQDVLRAACSDSGEGSLTVRRPQMEHTPDEVIGRVLERKLSKLGNTQADKHVLILGRQHVNLFPRRILEKIDCQRSKFPELASVDEIWILETMFYELEGYILYSFPTP